MAGLRDGVRLRRVRTKYTERRRSGKGWGRVSGVGCRVIGTELGVGDGVVVRRTKPIYAGFLGVWANRGPTLSHFWDRLEAVWPTEDGRGARKDLVVTRGSWCVRGLWGRMSEVLAVRGSRRFDFSTFSGVGRRAVKRWQGDGVTSRRSRRIGGARGIR